MILSHRTCSMISVIVRADTDSELDILARGLAALVRPAVAARDAHQRAVALARALVLERALRRRGHTLGHVSRAGAFQGPRAGRRAEIPTQALDLDRRLVLEAAVRRVAVMCGVLARADKREREPLLLLALAHAQADGGGGREQRREERLANHDGMSLRGRQKMACRRVASIPCPGP